MKVLFTFGGLPHYYNYVLSKLNNVNGLEIVVVVPKGKGKTLGEGVFQSTEGINFKIIECEEYKSWYGKSFFKNFSELIGEVKPEIIVMIWPYILSLIFKPLLLMKLKKQNIKLIYKDIPFGIPLFKEGITFKANVVTENTKEKKKSLEKLNIFFLTIFRKIYLNIVDAHVNYIEEAYNILGSYGVPKEKIFITYNSPNTDILFDAEKKASEASPILPENIYRIIHVGRLVKWKKVDLLIEAAAKLKEKYNLFEFIIIGTGPEEKYLKDLVRKLNIEENVKFIGAVYDPIILGRYFKASSIYVLGGMGGLSINEAMAFGKPVICSVCDGTEKKLVRENYNGKYFEENNLDDLVKKISLLLNDKEKLNKMGKNSFSIIRNEVNIHTVIKGYLEAFNYVTNNKYDLSYKP